MKTINGIMNKVNKLLDDTRKEYAKTQDSINEYKIKLSNATADMETCTNACDLDGYNKAREEKNKAEGAVEMYNARADRLESDPLISEEEYNKYCDDIIEEFINYMVGLKGQLYDLSTQMCNLERDARDTIKETNDALHTIQYDVYRGKDLKYLSDGKHVEGQSEKKVGSRSDWDLIEWASLPGQSQAYKDMKKEREA